MATNIAPEQLTKANYEKWSACMKNYLIANDLWDIIESNMDPSNQVEDEAEFKAWQKKKAAALYVLQVSCSSELFHIIKPFDSAKACWNKLAQEFQKEEEKVKDEDDRFLPLWKAIGEGDSNAVKDFLKSHPDAVKQRNNEGMTALHLAVKNDKADVVKEIVEFMPEEDIQLTDHDHDHDPPNPFKLACHRGSLTIVNLLLNKDALGSFIEEKSLDIHKTLDLFNRLSFTIPSGLSGEDLLLLLSRNSDLFPSHGHFSFTKRCLCSGIGVKLPPRSHPPRDIRIPMSMIEQDWQMNSSKNLIQVFVRLWRRLSSSVQQISGYKHLYDLKLRHCCAKELLQLALQNIPEGSQCIQSKSVKKALFNAAENGIVEIFDELRKHYTDLLSIRNDEGRTVFQQAIECRQEKIFSRVHKLPVELKKKALAGTDKKGNDSLEIAGMLASQRILAKISSPALQMQSELKWFKEVESVYPYPPGESLKDIKIKGARQKFAESHKELKDKGEKWYKEVATSSTVVGTLIITIMFAVAFTVPGGNNSNGLPEFLNEWAFKVFILADAISLFCSLTAVTIFMGILTARYEYHDFLVKLPRKLIVALPSLFVSIEAMVICFCAAVIIMLHGDLKLIIPIGLLAISPVGAFIFLQFPLLKDVLCSTIRSWIRT